MTRIAVIADVHGNAPALDAVLAAVEQESPDLVVLAGDAAGGLWQSAVLGRLMALNRARFVRGNVDRVMVQAFDEGWTFDPEEQTPWRKAGGWIAERMTKEHRDFLASFEETVALDDVLVCHGSPRSDDETMTSLTPEADMREMFAGVDQRLVVCGHTHVQFDRTVGRTRIVNTGSVGMPFQAPSAAYWLLLGPEPELRRTDYDVERTAAAIGASDYWDAENAALQLVDPPDPHAMEELYERARVQRSSA
jgi:putative phosphoesterase